MSQDPRMRPLHESQVSYDTTALARDEFSRARSAQTDWAERSVAGRLALVRRLRHLIAAEAERLAATVHLPPRASLAETVAAEVVPLADACRFVERAAGRALAPRRMGWRGRPAWLFGTSLRIHREPCGVVLILGAWNYPLLLPGVQMVQALAAGNAVLVKPGRGGGEAAQALAELCDRAGFDRHLVRVLPESPETARAALALGVDKIVLASSVATDEALLAQAIPHLSPTVAERSGTSAAFVREDADLDRVVRALAFAVQFNGGATCIAPRPVFVHRAVAARLEERLAKAIGALPAVALDPKEAHRIRELVAEAVAGGARLLAGELDRQRPLRPILIADAVPGLRLMQADVYAPVLALIPVTDDAHALATARECPRAIGAAVFGSTGKATALAEKVRARCVVVNDMIVPAADPRLPFGGLEQSGFGVTRGLEGLLEMTTVKAIVVRHSPGIPYLDASRSEVSRLLNTYLIAAHAGSWRHRLAARIELLRALFFRRLR